MESIPLNLLKVPSYVEVTPKFQKNILRNFRNYETGNVCGTDNNIIFLGTGFYWKLKGKEGGKGPEL